MKRIITLSTLICFAFFMVACNSPERNYSKGVKYYKKGDYGKAYEKLSLAIEKQHWVALYYIAEMHFNGQGVPEDKTKAMRIFEQAAQYGDQDAIIKLINIYYNAKQYEPMLNWYSKTNQKNHTPEFKNMVAKGQLGQALEMEQSGQHKSALKLYNDALANTDLAELQGTLLHRLGHLHRSGYLGKINKPEAIKLFQEALSKSFYEAAYCIGETILSESQTEVDYSEAIKFYEIAANQNVAKAANKLGDLYLNGKGVTKNTEQAIEWYKIAVKEGDLKAHDSFWQTNSSEAFDYYTKLDKEGNINGTFFLADLVVNRDENQGMSLFVKASKAGNKKAKAEIDKRCASANRRMGGMYSNPNPYMLQESRNFINKYCK